MKSKAGLNLILLTDKLAVCYLPPQSPFPEWALPGDILALVRTRNELSVVCANRFVPLEVKAERNWRAFEVQGPLDFSLVGILASITAPLAKAGVSIFALSSYQTDYILVKQNSLSLAIEALEQSGFTILGA